MRKKIKFLSLFFSAVIVLTGCSIFPKEEELQRTPIIQAYQQEEFKMAEVKRGDIQLYEKLDAVCMSIGETSYSFDLSNLAYKGIYVQQGQEVKQGDALAELIASYDDAQVADASQLTLKAKEDSRVTFVMSVEDGEKSIAGQVVVIANSQDAFYLNAYTKYWQKFKIGDQIMVHFRGEDYMADIVDAVDLGLDPVKRPESSEEESEVYFRIREEGLYLKSQDTGSVEMLVDEKKDVLYVPEAAVTTVDDKEIVYVENADGIRSVQYVETGLHADHKVEIISGLQQGDKVILE